MLFAYGTSSIWNQLGKLCAACAAAQKLVQYSHSLKGKVELDIVLQCSSTGTDDVLHAKKDSRLKAVCRKIGSK